MRILASVTEMQATALAWRRQGRRIGFVPTMGYLHEGHLSLIALARQQADVVVVSLFVNPTQFGPHEDFERYPRDWERDRQLCEKAGADILFAPATGDMYAPGATVVVDEDQLSRMLCGASRPGHFRGVLTVVAKLFNLVQPDVAVFGQKDAQQLRLIRQLVRDLNFPVTVIAAPIIREPDGLAMSSRNKFLSPEERRQALCLSRALRLARDLYRRGERRSETLKSEMTSLISAHAATRLDYLAIQEPDTLLPLAEIGTDALIALAVWVGQTRLIDNLLLPDDRLGNLP